MEKYTVTGNDYVSLPKITEKGDIEDFTFLHMGVKGMFDVAGNGETPFLRSFLKVNGAAPRERNVKQDKINFWIPRFIKEYTDGNLEQTILAPTEGRGFMIRSTFVNTTDESVEIELGTEGRWAETRREINNTDNVENWKFVSYGWYDTPVFGIKDTVPLFTFAFLFDKGVEKEVSCDGACVNYRFSRKCRVEPGSSITLDCAMGVGYDSVASVTSALEFLRQTFDKLLSETCAFLSERSFLTGNPLADRKLNYNLFFSYYFAAGVTLDTEELVMITSRSPRYYVSAAYWDRDGLLWAFPAILKVDTARAKAMLEYVFTRQIRNVGVHSRYIDGTVLEPGFELDELCAPAVALCRYYEKTGDRSFISERFVVDGIKRILAVLKTKKHSEIDLYETFLYPSDDMNDYIYLTYDNVLVWSMLKKLAKTYRGVLDDRFCTECEKLAGDTEKAIYERCVVEEKGKRVFAWCVDLNGSHKIYDEPPGSLVLLHYLGFCEMENEIFANTLEMLYAEEYVYSFSGERFSEIGCAHNPHPWVLSYCNSILAGRGDAKTIGQMLDMHMDNDVACESVSEKDGTCTSGEAFATCAGLYAYALMTYFEKRN